MRPLLSIVSPVYLGAPFIHELVNRVKKAAEEVAMDYEIILVNDASPDNSWEIIEGICAKYDKVIGLNLSRNFGQHYAITAGLVHSRGEWIVVMDCDLQDRPEEITKLVRKAQEGYDLVLARRTQRKDSFFKRLFSRCFYRSLSWLTGIPYDHGVANFGIYKRKVIDAILDMGDSIRYFPTMVVWVGFKKTTIDVQHEARSDGKSAYNFRKLIHLAMDIILSYSDKPIRLAIKAGLLISVLAFLATLYTLISAFYGLIEVPGYASTIISIWFFSGLIISFMGLVGLYVSKTFQSVKNRPVFIVSDKINHE